MDPEKLNRRAFCTAVHNVTLCSSLCCLIASLQALAKKLRRGAFHRSTIQLQPGSSSTITQHPSTSPSSISYNRRSHPHNLSKHVGYFPLSHVITSTTTKCRASRKKPTTTSTPLIRASHVPQALSLARADSLPSPLLAGGSVISC